MIKLYGSPLSNYVCMVKSALIEKQIPFEMVAARPSQDPAWLAMSAMGKIPCIQTESGYLAETRAILDYLEESSPTPARTGRSGRSAQGSGLSPCRRGRRRAPAIAWISPGRACPACGFQSRWRRGARAAGWLDRLEDD